MNEAEAFTGPGLEARDRATVLVHYYRAMAARADIWRTRMDATTNWAIGSTAAILSFVLGDPQAPPSAIFIASLLTLAFLLLEARRLTVYHMWQRRVLLLERSLVRPALQGETAPDEDGRAALQELLGRHLGRTVPSMPIGKAAARRFRRIYLYLFAVQALAWGLKVAEHPAPVVSLREWFERVVGAAPGGPWVPVAFSVAIGVAAVAFWRAGGIDRRDPVGELPGA